MNEKAEQGKAIVVQLLGTLKQVSTQQAQLGRSLAFVIEQQQKLSERLSQIEAKLDLLSDGVESLALGVEAPDPVQAGAATFARGLGRAVLQGVLGAKPSLPPFVPPFPPPYPGVYPGMPPHQNGRQY